MISGDLKGPGDLLEILSGFPASKSGYLNLISRNLFLSLKLEKSKVKGFFTNYEVKSTKNPLNALTFVLSEMLSDTEGYFSFEENTAISEFIPVDEELESLVIKATIVRKEIEEILPLIITSSAVFTSKNAEYKDRSLFEILSNAEDPIEKLRELKNLLENGEVEVKELKETSSLEELGLDYILESVEYKKVNLLKILEALRNMKFTGFLEIEGDRKTLYTFFKKGEIFGIHPVSVEIFDYLMEYYSEFKASIVKLKEEFVETFAQAFIGKPVIASESKYISLGKLFLTFLSLREEGVLKIIKNGESYIFIFRNGKLFSARKTKRWEENWKVLLPDSQYTFLYREIYSTNVNYLFYVFLWNKILNVIKKHSLRDSENLVVRKTAEIPFIYMKNGRIEVLKNLNKKEEGEILKFLLFITEKVVSEIGREKFEKEIEEELKPYTEILRVLNLSTEISAVEEAL
ncbi:hypothetical protein [Aquifex aeolicus]|uniref:Uncharacterized protein n=1 Tax=Aquifex aeolicus (strain VF5) TaxID=224324 RepID=O67510_AQUAE|nr:hypothetical protein [Aquifex aeolicus]AAC07472.1 putative protein [Aquifex aeolicus VF5]